MKEEKNINHHGRLPKVHKKYTIIERVVTKVKLQIARELRTSQQG